MFGMRPGRRRQREIDAARKEGVDPFTHAMASELAEAAKRAIQAAEDAKAEHDRAAAQSDKHKVEGLEHQQEAHRATDEYHRACKQEADDRLKLAMLEEAAGEWAEVWEAGMKEAEAADEAAAAAWRIMAADAACVHAAEVAVEMADWGKGEAPRSEQAAWASRAKSAREWKESMEESGKPRTAAAVDAAAKAGKEAARARAHAAGARAVADEFRAEIRRAKRAGIGRAE